MASDLDRDGDLDLLVAHAKGLAWLDNLRQGRFADRTAASGLAAAGPCRSHRQRRSGQRRPARPVAAGPASPSGTTWAGGSTPGTVPGLPGGEALHRLCSPSTPTTTAASTSPPPAPEGLVVLGQRGRTIASAQFEPLPVEGAPEAAAPCSPPTSTATATSTSWPAGAAGLHRLENAAATRTTGSPCACAPSPQGNGKNNLQGLGSVVEVRAGTAYQFREAAGRPVHFGLGSLQPGRRAAGGVDQRRPPEPPPAADRPADRGGAGPQGELPLPLCLERRAFRLRHRPALELADRPARGARRLGRRRPARVGAGGRRASRGGRLPPAGHRGALGGRLLRRRPPLGGRPPDGGRGGEQPAGGARRAPAGAACSPRRERPPRGRAPGTAAAPRSRRRSGRATRSTPPASTPSPYQGVAQAWTFTFDLGEAPGAPVRLLLDGWIFPADASLNLAVAQRPDFPNVPPRLEVETGGGLAGLIPAMGFPAGKTKTMVVDTPAAARREPAACASSPPSGSAGTASPGPAPPADDVPVVRARLEPRAADLRYRGFSRLLRRAPNAPHDYDYEDDRRRTPPGCPSPAATPATATCGELLVETDDRSVILAPGDEIALEFDAADLPPRPPGWTPHRLPREPTAGTRTPTATPSRPGRWSRSPSAR